jgi:hypothetical protein
LHLSVHCVDELLTESYIVENCRDCGRCTNLQILRLCVLRDVLLTAVMCRLCVERKPSDTHQAADGDDCSLWELRNSYLSGIPTEAVVVLYGNWALARFKMSLIVSGVPT